MLMLKKNKVRRKGYCQSVATPVSVKSVSLSQLSPFSRWDFPAACQEAIERLLGCVSSSNGDTGVQKGHYRNNGKKGIVTRSCRQTHYPLWEVK